VLGEASVRTHAFNGKRKPEGRSGLERQFDGLLGFVARLGPGRLVRDALEEKVGVGLEPDRLVPPGRFGHLPHLLVFGKIVISENASLDGIAQDPTGEEGFRHGGWFVQVGDKDREEWARAEFEEALGAEALLLGRRSDEYFGSRWNSRSGEWADRLNSLPKYVVSSTLDDPVWNNSTVLKGEVVKEVSTLKQELRVR
jgi:hypothetical protein